MTSMALVAEGGALSFGPVLGAPGWIRFPAWYSRISESPSRGAVPRSNGPGREEQVSDKAEPLAFLSRGREFHPPPPLAGIYRQDPGVC